MGGVDDQAAALDGDGLAGRIRDEAQAIFQKLVDYGQNHMDDDVKIDYFAISLPDFLVFDEDLDEVGDTPYELYVYADRIWQDVPYAQFFKGSPVLEVMDFLERLAPFTEPRLLVRDDSPSKHRAVALLEEKVEVKDSLDILRESLGR